MDRISIYYGVLSKDLIDKIKAFSFSKKEHRVNLTSWTSAVTGFSGAIMLFDLSQELQDEVKKQIETILNLPKAEFVWEIVYTLGGRLSFIPWHDDGDYIRACTIYLNESWDKDWAGMFVYEDGPKEIKAIYPEYNKCVVMYPPIMHTTTMPSINAPLRESLQIFIKHNGENGER